MNNPEARKKRNADLTKQIIALYIAGNSYREIANTLKISHEWARRLHLSTPVSRQTLTADKEKDNL